MAGTTALPLQEFIASLDNTCLPKILQVCSGVYFQGSIYEISGSEVCFSTGDLIKVINIELVSVCCEDISKHEKFELPLSHTGLFKVVPEEMPYSTIEEMVRLRPVELESCLPFTFTSRSKMTFGNFTLGAGRALTVICIERREGEEDRARCHVQGQQEASAEVCIPLSSRGEFYECESEECFTLVEIMSSPCLRSRRFRFINTTKCERRLVLSPVYQVHAIMNLRKNVLKFPSSLEVDVVDVTEMCQDVNFVTPISLTEVLSQPDESFPVVAEVLEGPDTRNLFKCSWLPEIIKNQRLVLHKKGTSAMILLSSLKSRKVQQYFLVSQQYGGRFRRRPREFNSVYELYAASIQAPGLKVSVTRNCEDVEEEGLPALSVGDQLEIVRCDRLELPCGSTGGPKQSVEVKREDVKEEIFLPLYMQGHFVEVLSDNKKYRLRDLGKEFTLPLDVKVVSRDTELETDPLVGFACLRIEGAMLEPTIQASFTHKPDCCFEIPTKWVSMSVSFTEESPPWPEGESPKCHVERVTEVTDTFFYEFCKQDNLHVAPPPRPPKRNMSISKPSKKAQSKSSKKSEKAEKSKHQPGKSVPTKQFSDLTLNSKRRPPEDINGNAVTEELERTKELFLKNTADIKHYLSFFPLVALSSDLTDEDSDHDYETVDDTLAVMVKKAQEDVMSEMNQSAVPGDEISNAVLKLI
uniref:Thymocyte selection associated family member 2 n=1 Tax=Stegastes partitus TaxID=144197 RepID=A0A3B5ATH6_9TELE